MYQLLKDLFMSVNAHKLINPATGNYFANLSEPDDLDINCTLFNTDIRLYRKGKAVDVTLELNGLRIRPTNLSDIEFYANSLYMQKEVMKNIWTGATFGRAHAEKRVTGWSEKWATGDLFSAFVVELKGSDSYTRIAHAILGGGNNPVGYNAAYDFPGTSEMAIMISPDYQHKGHGTQITRLLLVWARFCLAVNARINKSEASPTGFPFQAIFATTKPDGAAMKLEKLGFKNIGTSPVTTTQGNVIERNLLLLSAENLEAAIAQIPLPSL